MILDTSIIIGLRRGDPACIAAVEAHTNNGEPFTTTTITLFELHSGAARSNDQSKEMQRITNVLQSQQIYGLDTLAASTAGKIHGELFRKGTPVSANDCLIAGIALAKGESVLTKNGKDFKRIPGLAVREC